MAAVRAAEVAVRGTPSPLMSCWRLDRMKERLSPPRSRAASETSKHSGRHTPAAVVYVLLDCLGVLQQPCIGRTRVECEQGERRVRQPAGGEDGG